MSQGQIKKLFILQILEVLKKFSDDQHPLSQQDIINIMEREYGATCERKAVGRNIDNLKDLGYDIVYNNGFYLVEREFEDCQLRMLIDTVMASKHIPKGDALELSRKLANLSTIYFKKSLKNLNSIKNMDHHNNNQLFYSVDILCEAISKNKQVEFFYRKYNVEKKLTATSTKKHVVNPYQLFVANGKYYLLGNVDKYDNPTHFRIDKITDIKILETRRKPVNRLPEFKGGLDLPKHLVERVYMYDGPVSLVKMKVNKDIIDSVIDWLGTEIDIEETGEDYVTVTTRTNEKAIKFWALQFGESVEVKEPLSLREEIKNSVNTIKDKYKD